MAKGKGKQSKARLQGRRAASSGRGYRAGVRVICVHCIRRGKRERVGVVKAYQLAGRQRLGAGSLRGYGVNQRRLLGTGQHGVTAYNIAATGQRRRRLMGKLGKGKLALGWPGRLARPRPGFVSYWLLAKIKKKKKK